MKKVVKFGGSSLASAKQFQKVGNIIREEESRCYVVPSAPGKRNNKDTKVTDMLYATYALAEKGKSFSKELEQIKARYQEIIDGLGLKTDLSGEFKTIEKNFKAKKGTDYAASRGEYLNVTFSRGGSDVTGSIVARASKADVYENWTDVSGFLVADPRIIQNPEIIDTITYKELRELSYMGASVLHEDAIFPVRQEGIPINIRNTNDPSANGTWIVASTGQKSKYTITGIAGKKGFCSVMLEKEMMNSEIGFGRKVLQAFEDKGVTFEHMPSGIDTMTVLVHQDEFMNKEQSVVAQIQRTVHPDSIEIESDLALIAVVGRGMKSSRGTAGRIFSALAHANVNVRMIDQGSSEMNIIIGVENADFEAAIAAIYNIFVVAKL